MLVAGTRLGAYEVLAPLGAGGMGEVWRARDTRLGRDVALKVLPEAFARDADRLARFEREARAAAALNHPNIVTLYAIEEAAGTRFLTMELVEGRTLGNLVTPGGLPLGELLGLAIPLAEALVAAHERGVVHRDLKPANVMLTRDGRVKVLDFGLARLTQGGPEDAADSRVATMASPPSEPGHVLGTVPYMAPEQIRGEGSDARSDLFAYGVLVFELATGRRPFTGQTLADVSSAILRDPPAPLASLRPDLPADLGRILERCLAKNPRERIQTALDVVNELRAVRRAGEPAPGQVGAAGEARKPAAGPARAAAAAPAAAPPAQGAASIAVLPFVNRSASADDEYFSDGLADELLSVLAKIRGLRVAARSSAFTFKGRQATVAEVGRALNVATVLEGTVRKAGNRVRIAVQLVKADDGFQLWSETYDRTLDDIFAVQDDIAQSVVKELRSTLLGKEDDSEASGEARADVARASKGRATDPEAHRLWLQGRYLIERITSEDTRRGIEYLEQALAIDPGFAVAWADLSRGAARIGGMGWGPQEEWLARAREAAERALALEPDLPEGLMSLGWLQMYFDRDWHGAEDSLRRALEAAPGNAAALRTAATLAANLGQIERAVELNRRALEADPLSAATYHNMGLYYDALGRFSEAEQAFRKSIELSPHSVNRYLYLTFVLLAQGRGEEALATLQEEPQEWARQFGLAIVHHALGHRAESDRALRELVENYHRDSAYQIAEAYAARGEADAAFAWLERAYAQNDPGLGEMLPSPRLRSLHGDPRWKPFLRKMGLAEE